MMELLVSSKRARGLGIVILHFLLLKSPLLRYFTISEIVLRFFLYVQAKGRADVESGDTELPVLKVFLVFFFYYYYFFKVSL